jgi:hypothetical protein
MPVLGVARPADEGAIDAGGGEIDQGLPHAAHLEGTSLCREQVHPIGAKRQ